MDGFIKQEIMDEADNYYASGLFQKMRDCKVYHCPGELAMSHTKTDDHEMNGTIKNENIDASNFIKQEIIDEADNNYTSELLEKMRDCNLSHIPGELTMPHTKLDNQEMNGTIKNESIDECMDECVDTSDDHNDVIRLLPRRIRRETQNTGVSFYGEENYEIDIIDGCVFEGFVRSVSHSSEFFAYVNSDLL